MYFVISRILGLETVGGSSYSGSTLPFFFFFDPRNLGIYDYGTPIPFIESSQGRINPHIAGLHASQASHATQPQLGLDYF